MIGPPVYVFARGEPGLYGLSILEDGSNLPPDRDGRHHWKLLQQVTLSDDDLRPFVDNPAVARSHLRICGSYRAKA
jgi:hypothetical protein